MRKLNFRKILSLALAAFVAFGTFAAGAVSVNAADDEWYIGVSDTIWTGSPYYMNGIGVYGEDSFATVTGATSSNTGVFSIKTETYDEGVEYYIKPVAPGTATLTVNFTTPSGETKSLPQNIVVKKYPKEIKSLKVNGKKVNTNKHKFFYNKKVSKKTTKVNVKMALKKGWKITDVYGWRFPKDGDGKSFKISKSVIMKGKSIKFSKKYISTSIFVEMKKGNDYISYSFDFYR